MRIAESLRRGELLSAGSAFALLVVLFVVPWYGVAGVPDPTRALPAVPGTQTGWQALTGTRWVLLLTALVALGALLAPLVLHGRSRGRPTGAPVLVLGLISVVLLLWRVVISLPAPAGVTDQKLGALIGLACACGIALGGHESLTARRSRHAPRGPAAPARPRAAPAGTVPAGAVPAGDPISGEQA